MNRSKFMYEDNVLINEIINEINNEKIKNNEFKKDFINDDKCISIIFSLFKKFYGENVNEGIYAVIFNNFDIYRKLVDVFFINDNIMIDLEVNNDYRLINCGIKNGYDDKLLLYFDGVDNYIYLDNREIVLRFREDILEIIYKSELGVSERNIYLFDKDGIVVERRIEKDTDSIKINGIDGYRCINNVSIVRDCDNLGYVKILDKIEIRLGNNLLSELDRRCSGYISPLYLFDLGNVLNLSNISYDYVMDIKSCLKEDGLIDMFFSDIKNVFVDRLNKNKGFSKKR